MVKHRFHELFCILKLGQESATYCSEVASGKLLCFSDHKVYCHLQYAHSFHYEKSKLLYFFRLLVFGESIFPIGERKILLDEI